MGLDASVYKKIDDVAPEWRPLVAYLSRETGELYFPNYEDEPNKDVLRELHERLTNMCGAGSMRQELNELFPEREPPMFDAFLHSGTHCGDHIPVSSLDAVDKDIAALRSRSNVSTDLQLFAEKVERLVAAARRTGNPKSF